MKVLLFGSDKPAARRVVDWLFEFGSVSALVILTKTGLARYAWERAGHLAKHRDHFYLDRFTKGRRAMPIAVHEAVHQGKPDVALCISPREHDQRIVDLLRDEGCKVIFGRLSPGRDVSWQEA